MTDLWHRLAGSHIPGYVAAFITFLATIVCTAMRHEVVTLFPDWGESFCAAVILIGAAIAWFSKSPANRRTDEAAQIVGFADGKTIANRRGLPKTDAEVE